jgi:hypothetical protein
VWLHSYNTSYSGGRNQEDHREIVLGPILKKPFIARPWWLMPVIRAIQEAEIRRILV